MNQENLWASEIRIAGGTVLEGSKEKRCFLQHLSFVKSIFDLPVNLLWV